MDVSRVRWLVVAGVAALVIAGVALWLAVRDTARRAPREVAVLDPDRFKGIVEQRVERARRMAAESDMRPVPRSAQPPAPADAAARWPSFGQGAFPDAGKKLIAPECVLGPAELCFALTDPIIACDAGNAEACLAVGKLLTETPPRPLIAVVFFVQACRIGDPRGCERLDGLQAKRSRPCAEDPFACAYRAQRTSDVALHEEACELGVADACALAAFHLADDADQRYTEAACQLGSARACFVLGARLLATCEPSEDAPCYPPDAARAEAALEMACVAGHIEACKR